MLHSCLKHFISILFLFCENWGSGEGKKFIAKVYTTSGWCSLIDTNNDYIALRDLLLPN